MLLSRPIPHFYLFSRRSLLKLLASTNLSLATSFSIVPISCLMFLNSYVSFVNSFRDLTLTSPLSILFCIPQFQQAPSSSSVDSSGLCNFDFKGHCIRDSSKQRAEAVSACEKFVSGVIDNLRDRFVSEGDGKVMSALCSIFDPSLISSTTPPSQETLNTFIDFLQKCFFSNSEDLCSEVVGFHEYVRHVGGRAG